MDWRVITMNQNSRRIQRQELLRTEWIVLVGEALVAIGSVVVVVGLIGAFKLLLRDDE